MQLLKRLRHLPSHRFHDESLLVFPHSDIDAGLVSYRSVQHFDKFVRDCKEAGIWSKLLLVMPFIGNTLSMAMRGFHSTSGAIAGIAVNFVGADYTEATGLTGNGTTKYVDIPFSSASLPATGHISVYQRNDNIQTGFRVCIGAQIGGVTDQFYLGSSNPSVASSVIYGKTFLCTAATAMVKGFYYGERQSTTDLKLYRNNTLLQTVATATTHAPGAINLYGWASNGDGVANSFNSFVGSFFSIGQALSATERAAFHEIVQTFQTNLGRAV